MVMVMDGLLRVHVGRLAAQRRADQGWKRNYNLVTCFIRSYILTSLYLLAFKGVAVGIRNAQKIAR